MPLLTRVITQICVDVGGVTIHLDVSNNIMDKESYWKALRGYGVKRDIEQIVLVKA